MSKLVVSILLFFCTLTSFASHIVGGDIYYDYLGNNQYRFYVNVYRDCFSSGAVYDSPLNFSVFRISNNSRFGDYEFTFNGSQPVPTNFNNPCGTAPTNICTEISVYQQVITLPPLAGGYRVAYQRCCRGPNINNLITPEDTGLTLSVDVPTSANNNYINSSPRFTNYPPLVLCNNDELIFDHSATDPDGDALVYSLVTPYAGGDALNPMPVPIPPPNYPLVTWAGGFSATQPLGAGSTLTINPVTGVISALPSMTGRFVVGIQVQEYRNGVLLSTMIRDFIFQVFNCNIVLGAALPTQQQLPNYTGSCDGNLQVQFINNSFGAVAYSWNFGVPGVTTDVSSAFQPTFNYPDTGTYIVTLVANPGQNCTDTAYMEILLYNEMNINFDVIDTVCQINNSFDFVPITDAPAGSSYDWDFGPNSNPLNSTLQNPQNITFTTAGWHYISVDANYAICSASYSDSVYLIPKPIADFTMPLNYECDGLTVNFINNTQFASTYEWVFGFNNQTSTDFEPTIDFPAGGNYVVELIAIGSEFCTDTAELTLNVNELMSVSFTTDEDQCITSNSFDFIGQAGGPPEAVFSWNFGNNASILTSNDLTVNDVVFLQPGDYTVTFSGSFDNCLETATEEIHIYAEPTIAFDLVDELQCAPYTANFINASTSETQLYYAWDFGDGSPISSIETPSYTYEDTGVFVVTLVVWTDEGCIDTLTLSRDDLIDVYPKPTAQFIVTPELVDICNSEVTFFDQSIGATNYSYWVDEGSTIIHESNFDFSYSTSGQHNPYLIVSNEEGCSDTARTQLFVEPFSVYIPNTFTPDGDEFNNEFVPKMWLTPSEWHLKIFNRWGEMVFESYDFEGGWNGMYDGKLVQSGTYGYVVEYKTCGVVPETVVFNGIVNVLR